MSFLVIALGACATDVAESAAPRQEELQLAEVESSGSELRVHRVAVDGETVEEFAFGSEDAVALVDDGEHSVSIEVGSTDGRNTVTVFSIDSLKRRSEAPSDRSHATVHLNVVEAEEDVLRRVLDVALFAFVSDAAGALNSRYDEDHEGPEVLEVLVTLDEIQQDPIADVIARDRRERMSIDEERAFRERVVIRRFNDIPALQATLFADIENVAGVEILETFVTSNTALVRVAARDLRALAISPGVRRIDTIRPVVPLAVDAWEAARAAQLDQFISLGNTGNRPNPTRHSRGRIALGIIDHSFEDDFESIGDARVTSAGTVTLTHA